MGEARRCLAEGEGRLMNTKIKNALYAVSLAGVVGALNEVLAISSSLNLEQPWPEVITLVLTWLIKEVEDAEKATGEPVADGGNKS